MASREQYNPNPGAIPPELIQHRSRLMEVLAAAGFKWPTHFSTIELDPANFGLVVCGLPDRIEAVRVLAILRRALSDWKHSSLFATEDSHDPGWRVKIARYRDESKPRIEDRG
jgi:hypothetical protein